MSNTIVQAQIDYGSNRNTGFSAFGEDEVARFFKDRRNSDDGSQVNHDLDIMKSLRSRKRKIS